MTEKRQTREALGVKAGDEVIIRGTVAFSEIAEKVEGDRLAQKVERQKKMGMIYPTDKPHYSLSIVDVSVDPKYQGTPLAKFYGQEVYTNKDNQTAMTLESKSPFAPKIFHNQGDGKAVEITKLPAEFGQGQEVQLLVRAFASKKFANLGSAFEAILLPAGDIKYYTSGASSQIEAFGLELDGVEAPVAQVDDLSTEDNPFGGSAEPVETVETPTIEAVTPEEVISNVPVDAKPAAPATGGAVDNPFA